MTANSGTRNKGREAGTLAGGFSAPTATVSGVVEISPITSHSHRHPRELSLWEHRTDTITRLGPGEISALFEGASEKEIESLRYDFFMGLSDEQFRAIPSRVFRMTLVADISREDYDRLIPKRVLDRLGISIRPERAVTYLANERDRGPQLLITKEVVNGRRRARVFIAALVVAGVLVVGILLSRMHIL
jgi:hypothetical protein